MVRYRSTANEDDPLMMPMMMRPILLALLLMSGQPAQAADPTVITLSCDGTTTDKSSTPLVTDHEPKPIQKMGVVANLNDRTVSFMGFIAPIILFDASVISFNGDQIGRAAQIASETGLSMRIDGILDRVTGHMTADIWTHSKSPDPASRLSDVRDHYDVLCKATNRVF
jgi:hypothetical protein